VVTRLLRYSAPSESPFRFHRSVPVQYVPLHSLAHSASSHRPACYWKIFSSVLLDVRGHAVAHLVEALRYKPEGRGFHSRWCHCYFSLIYSFRPYYGRGVDSACNRNEYQEYFLGGKGGLCVGLTTLPPSCADCLEIWEPQSPVMWLL
jgi:hypothetical protein